MDSSLVLGGVVCIGGFLAFAILIGVLSHQREKKRREALQHWAVRNRWQYQPRPAVQWWRRLPGHNRRGVALALSGTVGGRPVSIAEYTYTTSSSTPGADGAASTTTTTHRYVVFVVRLRRGWPGVAVHRRGAMSRVGRTLFGDKATALGYEPFDSAYRISADRAEVVREIFGRDLVAEHVAGRLPEWSVQGDELMAYETGQIDQPETIPARFAALVRVADLIDS
jgi:hypothetical protein